MRLIRVEETPFREVPYLNVCGNGDLIEARIPVYRGYVDRLPQGVEGVVCASDLQGHVVLPGRPRTPGDRVRDTELLGVCLPGFLQEMADAGAIPHPGRMGSILAGDLYADLWKRGGYGDTTRVWRAWGGSFRWVIGIAGNHDLFGTSGPRIPKFTGQGDIHVLDGDRVSRGGIVFGGLSGSIGNPKRPFRYEEEDYLDRLLDLLAQEMDCLVLHEGPGFPEQGLAGYSSIQMVLETLSRPLLAVRGHARWSVPYVTLGNGVQILNCEGRLMVLTAVSR